MESQEKQAIIEEYALHDKDVGSSDVQIAVLTKRIQDLTEHLKEHRMDHSSRRGLIALVNRRRRLLNYLRRKDFERYRNLLKRLGLRR